VTRAVGRRLLLRASGSQVFAGGSRQGAFSKRCFVRSASIGWAKITEVVDPERVTAIVALRASGFGQRVNLPAVAFRSGSACKLTARPVAPTPQRARLRRCGAVEGRLHGKLGRWAAACELGGISLRVAPALLATWSYGAQGSAGGITLPRWPKGALAPVSLPPLQQYGVGSPVRGSGTCGGTLAWSACGIRGRDPGALRATRVSDEDSAG
jgi:hypothetical protein